MNTEEPQHYDMVQKLQLIPPMVDVQEQIVEATHGHGCDVCVEASGNDNAIASLFDIAAHSARVRLIGHSIGRKVSVEIGKNHLENA